MRETLTREIISVGRQGGIWSATDGGESFGHSTDKEVARAAALRRARDLFDKGRACEVRVFGETSRWGE